MSRYPQHDKIQEISSQRELVQKFLDYLLDEAPVDVVKQLPDGWQESWVPQSASSLKHVCAEYALEPERQPVSELVCNQLLAGFFGIDLDALSREKEAMFAELQEQRHTSAAAAPAP